MSWTHPAYESVARLLSSHAGLQFAPALASTAETAMRRAMVRAGVRDPVHYRGLLECDPRALQDLLAEVTVGETYFFREPAHFHFLREMVLPTLREVAGIRVWSAGCSSGEEAYSLAILFESEGLGERVTVLGTDISAASLARARQGVYSEWSLRGQAPLLAGSYLRRQGKAVTVEERIRQRVCFSALNLVHDVYPALASNTWGLHVILCRNVLVYFNPSAVAAVFHRLFEALAPGGWLLTGASDPNPAQVAPFETHVTEYGTFYRRPPVMTAPPLPPARKSREAPAALASAAREALVRGDYARVIEITQGRSADPTLAVLHIRALAHVDLAGAERACEEATRQHPLSTEVHYLHAVLLIGLGRDADAIEALRRVLHLDRHLAVVHFTLALVLERRGDRAGARKAFESARALAVSRRPTDPIPLADGQQAGHLAVAARNQLLGIDGRERSG